MTSRTKRFGALVAVSAITIASCGGSNDDAAPSGGAGQAGVVLDTAVPVGSAGVESTTTSNAVPEPTDAPDTATPPPETDVAPDTSAPDTTAPAPDTTAPAPDTTVAPNRVPVGYRPINDESGDLRANVPAAWIEVDGAPDGVLRQLSAAPDLAGFLAGYTEPGMVLITGDAESPDAWMDGLATTLGIAETDGCTVSDTSDYSDGVYTGTEHLLSCGTNVSVAHLIGGRNSDGNLFFLLAIVRPTDDLDVRNQIVQSFFID